MEFFHRSPEAVVARSVSSGGIWYTPKPTIGISTPLFNVTPGTFMVTALVADGVDWFVPRVGLF